MLGINQLRMLGRGHYRYRWRYAAVSMQPRLRHDIGGTRNAAGKRPFMACGRLGAPNLSPV